MTTSTTPSRTRLDNGADLVPATDLEGIRKNSTHVQALIGNSRTAPKVPLTITLSAINRPNPCYGYGHQQGCPDDNLANIQPRHGGGRPRVVRWHLVVGEDDTSWIEGYLV